MKGQFPDLLGVRLIEATPERVTAEIELRDELLRGPGIVHGGALMAFADTLGAVGTILNLPSGAHTTTIESKTNFLGTAKAAAKITGECLPLHIGKQTIVWQTRISAGDKVVAIVTQTQMVVAGEPPPEQLIASLFGGKSREDQKELLAKLERGGAAVYRALAAGESDDGVKKELLECADREDDNAKMLENHSAAS
ncbi:MAG: PaaI family thioesterase [Chloroflexi bacterium]|nr:PaaI family thioesterase [Chloroflexota bacterium]